MLIAMMMKITTKERALGRRIFHGWGTDSQELSVVVVGFPMTLMSAFHETVEDESCFPSLKILRSKAVVVVFDWNF